MRILLSIIFVLVIRTVVAQSNNEFAYQDQYKSIQAFANTPQNTDPPIRSFKNDEATNQRNTGRVLTFVGIAAIVIDGAVALSTIGQTTTTTCNPCTIPTASNGDQLEELVFVAGAAMTTIGIIQWTKGSRRMKASKLSFNLKGRGGVLRYKF